MRNYFRYFFRDVHGTINDGGGLFPWDSFGYGASQEAVDASVQFQIDDTIKNLPPGWTLEDVKIDDTKTVFFLLDAANFNLLVTGIPNYFYDIGTKNLPYYKGLSQITDTPRYTGWKDEAGVKREPPPTDFKGAKQIGNVISSTIQQLGFLASKLITAGQPALAQRVANVILQIIQNKSVDQVVLNKLFDAIHSVLG
jgi:hypothetical protein